MKSRLDLTIGAFLFLCLALTVCVRAFTSPGRLSARERTKRIALPQKTKPQGVDLLAVYGSYQRGSGTSDAFRSVDRPGVLARPLGETRWDRKGEGGAEEGSADEGSGDAEGDKETVEVVPQLRVSLVMTTETVSRAVVDGCIVGVGDLTPAGHIKSIEENAIEVLWGEHVLRYALQRPDPILIDGRPIQKKHDESKR